MKIINIVAHIDEEASGPSYTVPRLSRSISARGHQVLLSCLRAKISIPGVELLVHSSWPFFKSFAISQSQAFFLSKKAKKVDIVHIHILWSMVSIIVGLIVPGEHAKLITSPRGTLSEWALRKSMWRKKLLWPIQKRVLVKADLIHATSEEEYMDIRRLGINTPVLVVPNGIDIPKINKPIKDKSLKTLIFISRIHPKKGIEILIDAWANLERKYDNWQLKIIGPGEKKYLESLNYRVSKKNLKQIKFLGPLYGLEKEAAYQEADLFVLPTHSENFGMVVAEALSHECPAIVSHGAPWSGLKNKGCGWWIPNNVKSFQTSLENAMSLPDSELKRMGARGREWMKRDFSWDKIAILMEEGYKWSIEGGSPPKTIRID